MNTLDEKLSLMKNLSVKLIRRSQGKQRAAITLSNEQIKLINETSKGDLLVSTEVTDEKGERVIVIEMNLAWVMKQ
jgi:hypothetical protein